MMRVLSIGECMIEMSGGEDGAWRLGFAGDTLNTLWYARAGLDPAECELAYLTTLGTDGFSDRMLAFLAASGIATRLVGRDPDRRPGLYLIERRDGDRHFTYWRDTSAARRLADDEAALGRAIEAAHLVYFSGITLAILEPARRATLIDLAASARARGARVAFDPNIRPALWESPDAMRASIALAAAASSIVLPSFDDEAGAFGDADPTDTLARYAGYGADEIVVKDGAAPVHLLAGGEASQIPSVPDVAVVDATAAGDSFNGAYLAARLSGEPPRAAAMAGRDMAARVVAARGALIETPEMARWRRG